MNQFHSRFGKISCIGNAEAFCGALLIGASSKNYCYFHCFLRQK